MDEKRRQIGREREDVIFGGFGRVIVGIPRQRPPIIPTRHIITRNPPPPPHALTYSRPHDVTVFGKIPQE